LIHGSTRWSSHTASRLSCSSAVTTADASNTWSRTSRRSTGNTERPPSSPSDVFITSICALHRNAFPRKELERMSKLKLRDSGNRTKEGMPIVEHSETSRLQRRTIPPGTPQGRLFKERGAYRDPNPGTTRPRHLLESKVIFERRRGTMQPLPKRIRVYSMDKGFHSSPLNATRSVSLESVIEQSFASSTNVHPLNLTGTVVFLSKNKPDLICM
jgi:hypothetical protein